MDWDNKDDTFHNEWQAYRTRDSRDLALSTEHEYVEPGGYTRWRPRTSCAGQHGVINDIALIM